MVKQSIHCNVCDKEIETINSGTIHDRKHQFGIKKHHEDWPGEMNIASLRGVTVHEAGLYKDHLCSYAHLQTYFLQEIAKEVRDERKRTKDGKQ